MTGRFVRASRFWRFILNRLGAAAITMPWRTVYIAPGHDSPELRRHEQVHLEQIDRYGPIWFSVLYIVYLCWYGYRESPLEREAYDREASQS